MWTSQAVHLFDALLRAHSPRKSRVYRYLKLAFSTVNIRTKIEKAHRMVMGTIENSTAGSPQDFVLPTRPSRVLLLAARGVG